MRLTVRGDMAVISSMPEPGLLARKVRCTDGDTWQPTSTSSTSFSKGASCLASAKRCSLGFQGSPSVHRMDTVNKQQLKKHTGVRNSNLVGKQALCTMWAQLTSSKMAARITDDSGCTHHR